MENPLDFSDIGAKTIRAEADALTELADILGEGFDRAVSMILDMDGRLVVSGIGKSGHIGRKISSTFASTGTPSFFIHPAEASHGDLGMIDRRDIVLAISKSGESPELRDIVAYCCRHDIPLLAITENPDSALGKAATVVLLLPKLSEACPLGVAPTTSTTMTLALGDALAVACLSHRDFRLHNFREFHPGGKLGQKLARVRDIMHSGNELPIVPLGASIGDAILEMTRTRFGCVGIVDREGKLVGIFTDGDLRRNFPTMVIDHPIDKLMTMNPWKITMDALIEDVAHLFAVHRIPSVFVIVDEKPVGIIHVHDLFERGLV